MSENKCQAELAVECEAQVTGHDRTMADLIDELTALRAALAEAVPVLIKPDGTWLHFKASGQEALLRIESLAETRPGIIGSALSRWCNERRTATLREEGGEG